MADLPFFDLNKPVALTPPPAPINLSVKTGMPKYDGLIQQYPEAELNGTRVTNLSIYHIEGKITAIRYVGLDYKIYNIEPGTKGSVSIATSATGSGLPRITIDLSATPDTYDDELDTVMEAMALHSGDIPSPPRATVHAVTPVAAPMPVGERARRSRLFTPPA